VIASFVVSAVNRLVAAVAARASKVSGLAFSELDETKQLQ
jgi:hypothetical protein